MKRHFILAFAIANLSPAYSQPPASSSNAVIAWGKSIGALKVGISCDNTTSDLRRLPKIFFHVANDGDKEIPGIILSGSECIVTVNGQHYAQESYGGKSSWMPPGRKYGPIAIDTDRLRQIPELRARPTITQTAPRPELREGTNTLSVHYMRDEKLVESGQIQIIANAPDGVHTQAADEPLIPTPLNEVLLKIRPGMATNQVVSALSTAYPKVAGHRGDWSGQTGYVDYKLDERFTLSISSVTRNGKEVVHDDLLRTPQTIIASTAIA